MEKPVIELLWESPGIQQRDNCDFEVLGFLLLSKIMKGFYKKRAWLKARLKRARG